MLNLIRDILAYSQVAAEIREPVRVDLNETMREVVSDFELSIAQRRALIRFSDLPCVQGVPLQMTQLFGNLLSNALKFAREDEPLVIDIGSAVFEPDAHPVVRAHLRDADRYYYITVRDNGIGFNHEQAEKIFNIFQRLHGKNDYEGTGIGLATCRKIVQNHGGYMYATSATGQGATFHMVLPGC